MRVRGCIVTDRILSKHRFTALQLNNLELIQSMRLAAGVLCHGTCSLHPSLPTYLNTRRPRKIQPTTRPAVKVVRHCCWLLSLLYLKIIANRHIWCRYKLQQRKNWFSIDSKLGNSSFKPQIRFNCCWGVNDSFVARVHDAAVWRCGGWVGALCTRQTTRFLINVRQNNAASSTNLLAFVGTNQPGTRSIVEQQQL